MPDTVENRVECFKAADELRKQGKPIWTYTLNFSDVFHNDNLEFEEKLERIVNIIKRSRWYLNQDGYSELHYLIDDLADSVDEDEFNEYWDNLYDLADYDRVWINTF